MTLTIKKHIQVGGGRQQQIKYNLEKTNLGLGQKNKSKNNCVKSKTVCNPKKLLAVWEGASGHMLLTIKFIHATRDNQFDYISKDNSWINVSRDLTCSFRTAIEAAIHKDRLFYVYSHHFFRAAIWIMWRLNADLLKEWRYSRALQNVCCQGTNEIGRAAKRIDHYCHTNYKQ